MSWIFVALLAYFLLAVANLADKFLVDNVLKSAKAYAFVVCTLGLAVFAAAPWLLEWPGLNLFIFNLINGVLFAIALWLLFEALKRGEASRVLVLIGGSTPIFSLILSALILKEQFLPSQLLGIFIILAGVFLIAFLPRERNLLKRLMFWLKIKNKKNSLALKFALSSAFFYSLYFISTKIAYNYQSFASSFIWTRLGAFLFALLFLIKLYDREEVKKMFQGSKKDKAQTSRGRLFVFLNQIIGSSGFILQNYAIFLGSVVLVNALQGVQYAFILVFSAGLSLLAPKILKEKFSKRIIIQKSGAVI
ncbi:DMT family transporter, partial [Patescibacteria group bacterium]|nr:DMT family transporter [Patescibacteria group bacterium]